MTLIFILFHFNWFLFKLIYRIAFNIFKNRIIIVLEIDGYLSNPVLLKINMQIIHTMHYVNLYFFVIYNTDCKILNTLKRAIFSQN